MILDGCNIFDICIVSNIMKIETIFIQGLNKKITFYIGENKADNFQVIDVSSPKDIWIHANNISSCHVVCQIPEGIQSKEHRYIVKAGALLCKKNTNKLKCLSNIEFIYAKIQHVEKTDVIGCVSVSNSKYIIL